MKIYSEKMKKMAIRGTIVVGVALIAVYVWEYKCALMRPATGCSTFCEDRVYIAAFVDNDPVAGHICMPWYYKWIGK